MALWVCGQCATVYAVGLPACPQCGSTTYRPDYEEATVGNSNVTSAGMFFDEGKEPPGYTDPRSEAPAEEPQVPAEEPQAPAEPQPPTPAPPTPKLSPPPVPQGDG